MKFLSAIRAILPALGREGLDGTKGGVQYGKRNAEIRPERAQGLLMGLGKTPSALSNQLLLGAPDEFAIYDQTKSVVLKHGDRQPKEVQVFKVKDLQREKFSGRVKWVIHPLHGLVMGKDGAGHIDLMGGRQFRSGPLAAGEAYFKHGKVVRIDNRSGHYQPDGNEQAAIVKNHFNKEGCDLQHTKYVVMQWHAAIQAYRPASLQEMDDACDVFVP